jgi:hypothetical protein
VAAVQQLLFAGAGAATVSDALLREDGFYVLREDSGKVLLESAVTGDSLLREDGFYVLREDDGRILLDGVASESPVFLETIVLPLLLRPDGDYT